MSCRRRLGRRDDEDEGRVEVQNCIFSRGKAQFIGLMPEELFPSGCGGTGRTGVVLRGDLAKVDDEEQRRLLLVIGSMRVTTWACPVVVSGWGAAVAV